MQMNLYQKTIYEVYQARAFLGYKIFDFDEMFAVLWNDQQMAYFNMIHARQFGKKEFDAIKKNIPDTFFCVAAANEMTDDLAEVKKGTPSYLMVLNAESKFEENKAFKILRVSDVKTAMDFCEVATTVYHKTEDKAALLKSFMAELQLGHCFRYVGYINDEPAGCVEFAEGKEAVCVSWGAVKDEFRNKGLYKAMLYHAINHEIERGLKTIVLNSSEMGRDIYLKMGFVPLANRYNYILEA